jgi:peptidyl-prolyl cis-trans isomerase B (cyclophilin B)
VKRILILLLVCVLAGCGSDEEAATTQQTSASTSTTDSNPASSEGCSDATAQTHERSEPNEHLKLEADKTYRLVFETNCGDFTVTLDQKSAPNATGSLVSLARSGYFDDTYFHRIVPGFVIQGGDPTGTGSGGPGYQTHDKVSPAATYGHGVVAMAKAANEPPGTAGSQFFVVTADAALPAEYAVVGKVTDGLGVVDAIGALGDASEQPTQAIVIDKVRVETS